MRHVHKELRFWLPYVPLLSRAITAGRPGTDMILRGYFSPDSNILADRYSGGSVQRTDEPCGARPQVTEVDRCANPSSHWQYVAGHDNIRRFRRSFSGSGL